MISLKKGLVQCTTERRGGGRGEGESECYTEGSQGRWWGEKDVEGGGKGSLWGPEFVGVKGGALVQYCGNITLQNRALTRLKDGRIAMISKV